MCTVVQGEGTDYRKESGNLNRKMQLTINPHIFNACLSVDTLLPYMVLPAYVDSLEEKGYMLNFGFSDSTQGFMKYEDSPVKYAEKQWVLVSIASINKKSKMAMCTPATGEKVVPKTIVFEV